MDKIKDILRLLKDKRPDLMWLLSRFLFCIAGINLLIHGFILILIVIIPFSILLFNHNASGFLMWYFMPSIVFIVWLLYEICIFIYEELIDGDEDERN
jgi:hypothetical protein